MLLTGLILFAGACAGVAGQAAVQTMRNPDELLNAADRIIAARPWAPDMLGKAVAAKIERVADESDEYFSVYKGEPADGPFRSAEIRVPGPASSEKRTRVVLAVRDGIVIAMRDVTTRFGEASNIRVSPAHAKSAPSYIDYVRPWGTLSFGFKKSGSRELVEILLDANGK